MKGNRTANRGTIASHRPDCPCVGCEARRRGGPTPVRAWKLPEELTEFIRAMGGGPWLAGLVRQARERGLELRQPQDGLLQVLHGQVCVTGAHCQRGMAEQAADQVEAHPALDEARRKRVVDRALG